jgi:hypothetical protein
LRLLDKPLIFLACAVIPFLVTVVVSEPIWFSHDFFSFSFIAFEAGVAGA